MVDSHIFTVNDVVVNNSLLEVDNNFINQKKAHITKNKQQSTQDETCLTSPTLDYNSSSDTEYESTAPNSTRNSANFYVSDNGNIKPVGVEDFKKPITSSYDPLTPVTPVGQSFSKVPTLVTGYDNHGNAIEIDITREIVINTPEPKELRTSVELFMRKHLAHAAHEIGTSIDGTLPDSMDSFFVADLGSVQRQFNRFVTRLPNITPYFAVKCNPDSKVINHLNRLGAGFDCASKAELEAAVAVGCNPENIIFANPCKQISHIQFAHKVGVRMMTFDNVDELLKMKRFHPTAQAVMRVHTDDSKSMCRLGVKFGTPMASIPVLLSAAREIGMDVVGISFHVGSGCFDASAFEEAIIRARKGFQIAKDFGFNFRFLDVGGGFPGAMTTDGLSFEEIAAVLGPAIEKHFGDIENLKVIAEPGRFFVSAAYSLAANIIARRVIRGEPSSPPSVDFDATKSRNEQVRPATLASLLAQAGSSSSDEQSSNMSDSLYEGSSSTITNNGTDVNEVIIVNDNTDFHANGSDIDADVDTDSESGAASPTEERQADLFNEDTKICVTDSNEESSAASGEKKLFRYYNDLCSIDRPDQNCNFMYYLNDGIYGSFNCIMFDHAHAEPIILYRGKVSDIQGAACSLWGPTCDGIDCLGKEFILPELEIGDWLVFHNMGAYTTASASTFNGFPKSKVVYINSETGETYI